jgi:hypothetical protein
MKRDEVAIALESVVEGNKPALYREERWNLLARAEREGDDRSPLGSIGHPDTNRTGLLIRQRVCTKRRSDRGTITYSTTFAISNSDLPSAHTNRHLRTHTQAHADRDD